MRSYGSETGTGTLAGVSCTRVYNPILLYSRENILRSRDSWNERFFHARFTNWTISHGRRGMVWCAWCACTSNRIKIPVRVYITSPGAHPSANVIFVNCFETRSCVFVRDCVPVLWLCVGCRTTRAFTTNYGNRTTPSG